MAYAGILEINEPTEKKKGDLSRACYIARESATITCVLAEPQRWARFRVERKKLCVPWWKTVGLGRLEAAK